MTTVLGRPLAREVLLDGEPFKVVISPAGVCINKKGRRKATELPWDTILALGEPTSPRSERSCPPPQSDLAEPIAADVAKQIRSARDALERASDALQRAGNLPASVLQVLEPDPVYGRVDHHTDWFIEPLLTTEEIASILRLPRSRITTLSIPSLLFGGERRYRQSEVRRFLSEKEHEQPVKHWR